MISIKPLTITWFGLNRDPGCASACELLRAHLATLVTACVHSNT